MKTNKIILLLLILLLSACSNRISGRQDERNRIYVHQLQENLLQTIDMLTTFDDAADNMSGSIEGTQEYSSFLMNMTLESSRLINLIRMTASLNAIELEDHIELMISDLRPADIETMGKVNKTIDEGNLEYLHSAGESLSAQLGTLLKAIIAEEKIIAEQGYITRNYYRLLSHYFLFSLLKSFIEPGDFLSEENRNYLVLITQAIEATVVVDESSVPDVE